MKYHNKISKSNVKLIFSGVILTLIFILKGIFYRYSVNYSPIETRKNTYLNNKQIILEVNDRIEGQKLSIQEIISISDDITCNTLSFTFKPSSEISTENKTNCIGYSSRFNSIGNYILTRQKMRSEYEFNHLVGEIDLLGYNIHNLFNSSFFKNHDYNQVKNKNNDECFYIDPSLSDYTGIKFVSSKIGKKQ